MNDEELRHAVAEILFRTTDAVHPYDSWPDDAGKYEEAVSAVFGMPVVAAWRRDSEALAKVREVSAAFQQIPWPDALKGPAVDAMADIDTILATVMNGRTAEVAPS